MPRLVLFDATIPSVEMVKAALGGKFIGRVVHNINARHEAHELAQRGDHMLHDIGLLRSEVEHAAHVFVTHDALIELHDDQVRHGEEADNAAEDHGTDSLQSTNLRSRG